MMKKFQFIAFISLATVLIAYILSEVVPIHMNIFWYSLILFAIQYPSYLIISKQLQK